MCFNKQASNELNLASTSETRVVGYFQRCLSFTNAPIYILYCFYDSDFTGGFSPTDLSGLKKSFTADCTNRMKACISARRHERDSAQSSAAGHGCKSHVSDVILGHRRGNLDYALFILCFIMLKAVKSCLCAPHLKQRKRLEYCKRNRTVKLKRGNNSETKATPCGTLWHARLELDLCVLHSSV